MAQKLGISRQVVNKWERAEASHDTDNLIELAKLYDISIDELLLHKPTSQEKDESDEYVHVGLNGIHVKEKKGNEVHVSWDGIHVNEKDGHQVDIDKNGVFVDGEYHEQDDIHSHVMKHWHHDKYIFPCGAFLFLFIVAYVLIMRNFDEVLKWIILAFLSCICLDSLMKAFVKKKISKFDYPIFCVDVYLLVCWVNDYWHPGWIIFLTIPCFYSIAKYIDHRKTS